MLPAEAGRVSLPALLKELGARQVQSLLVEGGAETLGATVIPISGGNSKRQIVIMQDFGSTVLTSTPSYALSLAETAEELGIDFKKLKLKVGIFGAEGERLLERHLVRHPRDEQEGRRGAEVPGFPAQHDLDQLMGAFLLTGMSGMLWEPRIPPATKWPIWKGASASPVAGQVTLAEAVKVSRAGRVSRLG